MVRKRSRGYVTREESVKLARKFRKSKDKEFALVGILHIESETAKMYLLTPEELDDWSKRADKEGFHIKVFTKHMHRYTDVTQAQVADTIYKVGNRTPIKQVLHNLKVSNLDNELFELNKKEYPITTNKGLFIGDPCYIIPDKDWDEYLENYYQAEELGGNKHFIFKGKVVGTANTAYGDGTYMGDDHYEYDVDAGMIGVTPLELANTNASISGGRVIQGKQEASVKYNDGDIIVSLKGKDEIVIPTSYEPEDDYDEDYEWNEDYDF